MKGIKPLQRVTNILFSNSPNEKAAIIGCDFALKITTGWEIFFWPIKTKTGMNIMTEEKVMTEVMNLLEAEPAPASLPAALPAADIPSLREQLAILVSTGKCKEAIGVALTHEQVRRLDDKDVIRHYKRYETYVGAKTTETLIESFLTFSVKALGLLVKLEDTQALQNELKNDYIITKELSNLSGNIALRCGRLLAVANAFLITAKHVDFSAEEQRHPSRDSDGYPLTAVDEVPTGEKSSANAE